MCEPTTILAAASFAVEAGSEIAKNRAQKKQSQAVGKAADTSATQAISQLSLRENQTQDAASQSILSADRQARLASAEANLSAGESGVAGSSVDALLHDISRQDSEYKTATSQNLSNTTAQLEAEKVGARVQAANQKAGAPPPSNLATGIGIAGAGLNFASILIRRNTKANQT